MGWRNGSMVNSICCFAKDLDVVPAPTWCCTTVCHSSSRVFRCRLLTSVGTKHALHMAHTHICKQNTDAQKIKINLFLKKSNVLEIYKIKMETPSSSGVLGLAPLASELLTPMEAWFWAWNMMMQNPACPLCGSIPTYPWGFCHHSWVADRKVCQAGYPRFKFQLHPLWS